MIQHRFDRSSMAYRLGINKRAARPGHQPRTKSTRPRTPNVCVGVASLRLRRRMPRATPAFEPRLKPPPAQRQLFAWLPRAPPPSFPPTRSARHPPKRVPSDADARTAAALP